MSRPGKTAVEALALFALAWLLRLALLPAAAWTAGLAWRDLAFLYDGHMYIGIATSVPRLYEGIEKVCAVYPSSETYTGWLPGYPVLIAALRWLVRDFRVAAMLASQLASAAGVVLFYLLARRLSPRPLLAAVLFAFFPATWLLTGSLAFVESLYVTLAVAGFYALHRRWLGLAATLVGFALVTQKSGLVLLLVFAAVLWREEGSKALRHLPWALWALVPLALLQWHLFAVFGDPWVNVRVQRGFFGPHLFALPFERFLEGLLSPTQPFEGHFWLRKLLNALSCLFYVWVCVRAWRPGERRTELLLLWLTAVLLFNLCLGGVWSYHAFPRFMTLAAPPAILLSVDLLPAWRPAKAFAPLAAAALLCIGATLVDVHGAAGLLLRAWSPARLAEIASYCR